MAAMRAILVSIVFLLCLPATASAAIEGRVFLDRDGNGRHSADEPGVPGVKLSNGRDVVVTDADGRYRIAIESGDTLFLIKPPGHAVPRHADGVPDFWRHHLPAGSPALRYGGIAPASANGDFALRPATSDGAALEVLLFGDPQPKSMVDVGYFEADIVAPLVGKHAAALGMSLGDIVNDDLSLYPAVKAVMARLQTPWLHVPGNHDLDFDAVEDSGSLHSFRAAFGPADYAWEEPQASFIVLDDTIYLPGQRPSYIGGLREDQFEFLQAYLPTLDRERPLVIGVHIPFFDPRPGVETFRRADRERLFALLRDFRRVLLLSAHTHTQRHYFHGADSGWHGESPLHEYNVGAACGGFWTGVKDADGIPDAGMSDGTPNGYARLRIEPDGDYALAWQAARASADYQIALHAPRVLRQGAYPGVGLYANVFMGMVDTRVEYRIDDRDWQPMQRAVRADPRVLIENLRDDLAAELRGYDRLPEAEPSQHLWRAALPTDLAVGMHRIEVRAFDRWRGELRASTQYRLEAVAP